MSHSSLSETAYSVLDLAPVLEGEETSLSFRNSLDLARHAEKWGYSRYWLAEHHNMPGIASSATSVVIGHIAGGTETIRVGSGGIMLPNHAPLVIAEQFGTLESLFPGRIDLGLGRAPGTDFQTGRALRRDERGGADFESLVEELRGYFENPDGKKVKAVPGGGLDIPIWLLGSSGYSARLAAKLGLPFAFASHFNPEHTLDALELYRSSFEPGVLDAPYTVTGVNVIAAETDEEAEYLASSQKQQFLELVRGTPGKLKPPRYDIESLMMPHEKAALDRQLASSIYGSRDTVRQKLHSFVKETNSDEVMIVAQVYDHEARLNSYRITSDIFRNK
ncbi:LLM class flavin-dependent oxidoreductase [Alteribacter natronophilus]|uniref:LLM class flavin-dependent oxidoreductase n=1 Tax=Alteribacter natronophilus TaxID=2583810 RepID=UPI00110D6072|nr:LLM class flavin-dependent oxidoreductase [Alteribacter natronophilus]TMW73396.1 LLM class flavin-dependent oxidoreductase [Alteribacter natronophilus]